MKQIVIATDGSPSAREAVALGLELATEHAARVAFVHVAPSDDVIGGVGFGTTAVLPHRVTQGERQPLDEALALAAEAGVEATTEVLRGAVPADEIVAYADAARADLLVVGSRGHGGIATALLGSVSRGVLRESRRPVLVVREAAHAEEHAAV